VDCRIYDPTITTQTVWDPDTDPSGLNYFAMASVVKFGGRLFFAVGANDGGAEGAAGQAIWMKTSDDGGVTWSAAFQVFGDADHCTNPITEPGWSVQWQPCFTIVGDELWCQWFNTAFHYISKLAGPQGKWTTYRLVFDPADDYKPSLSTDLTTYGLQDDGLTTFPVFEDGGECAVASSADGVVLSDGRVALPVTFSSDNYTTTPGIVSNFTKYIKYNGILFCDNGDWTLTRVDTSLFGDFTAWEPVVFEDPGGNIFVLSRNLNMSGTDDDMFLVASSSDGGQTFSPSVSAKMRVPSARIGVKQVARRRWLATTCDSRVHSTRAIEQSSVDARKNVALFVSRRGVPDFIPGVGISGDDLLTNYPQGCVDGDDMLVAYNVGTGGAGKANTVMKLTRVSPIPSERCAWVHPRSASRLDPASPVDPTLVDATPDYLLFAGNNRVASTTEVTATSGITYAAWVSWSTIDADAIIDARYTGGGDYATRFGSALTKPGMVLPSITFTHGATLTANVPTFIAASLDNTAQTVTLYTAQGGAGFTTKTGYYKSILFSGLPSDGDTATINGTTYTFRSSASLANEVTIGATLADLTANLTAKLRTNSMQAGDIGEGRVIMARSDIATFSVSSGSGAMSIESGIPLDGARASIGYKGPSSSSVRPWVGRIYDAHVYDSALSIANMRNLHNRLATSLGYSNITGTSTSAGTPLLFLDPSDRDLDEFPLVGSAPYCEVDGDTLTLHGEASASVELPYGATKVDITYKLGALPEVAERYVIATFGDGDTPARLYIDADDPTSLYLENTLVAELDDPTDWNTTTVTISTRKVGIDNIECFFTGKPRCFLGNAYPQGLLASTKTTTFDVSTMRARQARSAGSS
jgi:hypothetical protein